MGKRIDLTGRTFGKWTIVCSAPSPDGYEHLQYWLCRCACGKEAVRRGSQLLYAERKGKLQSCQSCGTQLQITHGLSKTPEYKVWKSMLDRCTNPESDAYRHYGARGITVCERWHSLECFIEDMGQRPSAKHSLDRRDNNRGYYKENCRWTTSEEQNRNKRGTHVLTHHGRTMTVTEWAEVTGIPRGTIYMRINKANWSVRDALTTPVDSSKATSGVPATYTHNGKTQVLTEWAKDLGVKRHILANRLARGWSVERALSQ